MGETSSKFDKWYIISDLRISAFSTSINLKNYFATSTAGFAGVVTYEYNQSYHISAFQFVIIILKLMKAKQIHTSIAKTSPTNSTHFTNLYDSVECNLHIIHNIDKRLCQFLHHPWESAFKLKNCSQSFWLIARIMTSACNSQYYHRGSISHNWQFVHQLPRRDSVTIYP